MNVRILLLGTFSATFGMASAQVPDQMQSLDPGGRAMGSGTALAGTNADTLSAFWNPAGLGYVIGSSFGIAYRNLPESRTRLGNTLENPSRQTQGDSGGSTVSHLGYAFPVSRVKRGAGGTMALTYTLGGYIDDVATVPFGSALPSESGTFGVQDYEQRRRARADFYNLAYGRTNAAQTLSLGLAITYVQQRLEYAEDGQSNPAGAFTPFSLSSTGSGFGATLGVQYSPPRSPNVSFAASASTPIDLTNNTDTAAFYDRIPGRFLLAAASRREGYRGGQDYLVLGAQGEFYYGGKGSAEFPRDDQLAVGVGLEYGYSLRGATVPFRLGYRSQNGSDVFASRNTFTYGIGYRPADRRYAIDLSWGVPQGGGYDMAISASYRF